MTTALEGLRVLQIGAGEATAIAGMVLAENGAEVVIVEPPEGSSDRNRPGHVVWNRGKKSAVLDLDDAAGRQQLASLAQAVDGAIVALRPGSRRAAGCRRGDVAGGQSGARLRGDRRLRSTTVPWRSCPATRAWWPPRRVASTSTNGYRSGPIFTPVPIEGYGAAMLAVQGLLAALYARRAHRPTGSTSTRACCTRCRPTT